MVGSVQPGDIYAASEENLRRKVRNALARRFYAVTRKCAVRRRTGEGASLVKHSLIPLADRSIQLSRGLDPKFLNVWAETLPIFLSLVRKLVPSLRLLSSTDANEIEEVDDVGMVLGEFEKLNRDQQDKVAKGLALLWDTFTDAFDGVSGFQLASPIERQSYIERLNMAANRMEMARGSDVAFRYVTVELMRQYISFLQSGSEDPKAITLAGMVAPLIDCGRGISAELASSSTNARKAA